MTRRQVGQRPVVPVGEDLPGLGMTAVAFLGLEQHEWRIGEHGVAAQAVNSSPCPAAAAGLRSLTRRMISRAVTACPGREANAVYPTSATWASKTQQPSWSSPRAGTADRCPGLLTDAGDGRADLGAYPDGDGEMCPARRAAGTAGAP